MSFARLIKGLESLPEDQRALSAGALNGPMMPFAGILYDLERVPPESRYLITKYYYGETSDTGRACGCALGRLHELAAVGQARYRHELTMHVRRVLSALNDQFEPDDDTEAVCALRFRHVLAEVRKLAQGYTT